MHYDLIDLRLLVHIGETGNLTRAAERSFLSAPAASMRIKQLEEAFHTPLLVRHAKGVALTPAGERMFEHARALFGQIECMHADLQSFASGVKGRIRLLANSTATSTFLPDALSEFLAGHPDIDIELEESSSRDAAATVVKGGADMAVVAGDVVPEALEVLPLCRDKLVLIAPPGGGPAGDGPVRLADLLADHAFVGLGHGNSIQDFLERVVQPTGRRMNTRIQVGSLDAVCRMVEAGTGIAVVPRISARQFGAGRLRLLALEERWADRAFSLVRPRGRLLPATCELLIRHLQATVRSLDLADGSPADGDPADGDPADGDPIGGDPVGGDPISGDPAGRDPVAGVD